MWQYCVIICVHIKKQCRRTEWNNLSKFLWECTIVVKSLYSSLKNIYEFGPYSKMGRIIVIMNSSTNLRNWTRVPVVPGISCTFQHKEAMKMWSQTIRTCIDVWFDVNTLNRIGFFVFLFPLYFTQLIIFIHLQIFG